MVFGWFTKKNTPKRQSYIRTFVYAYDVSTSAGRGTQTAFIKLYHDDNGRHIDILCDKEDMNYVIQSIVYQQCEMWQDNKITLQKLDELCEDCDIRNVKHQSLTVTGN